MGRDDLLVGLSDEQLKKVKACKSQDELLKLARSEGVEYLQVFLFSKAVPENKVLPLL